MSMASTVRPWLWELLNFDCGIDEGRSAHCPTEEIVVSSFQVISESGALHQIKTISSACTVTSAAEDESIVLQVSQRRQGNRGYEYLTHYTDGTEDWVSAHEFIDDDGVTNLTWLNYADEDDLTAAFSSYTLDQLKVHSHC
jgi:hypothetical protein